MWPMPHDSLKSASLASALSAGPIADAAREAAYAALDIIEMRLPPDADLRLECAREIGRLLASGVLARLSP